MTDEQRKRVHAITYSTDDRAELAERIVTLKDENKKLQERVEWLDGECRKSMGASHKFFEMVGEYQKENEKLRKLVRDMRKAFFVLDIDHCQACPRDTINGPCTKYLVGGSNECSFEEDMRELGVEVSI